MPWNYIALMVLCVLMVVVGLWIGWVCWGHDAACWRKHKSPEATQPRRANQSFDSMDETERRRRNDPDPLMRYDP